MYIIVGWGTSSVEREGPFGGETKLSLISFYYFDEMLIVDIYSLMGYDYSEGLIVYAL